MTGHPLRSGLAQGGLVSVAVSIAILFWLPGWSYYATPVAERGYMAQHALLRPSGPAGQLFGITGTVLMLVPFAYMLRKRLGRRGPGSLQTFLEIHLFCGIVGPVLVTFHTSFKFNGLISAAYWSMVVVVASGFIGRYLYTQVPRSLRGTELTRAEIDREADRLRQELLDQTRDGPALAAIDRVEEAARSTTSWVGLLFGELAIRRRIRHLARSLRRTPLSEARRRQLIQVTRQRALLLRRIACLQKTRTAFSLWHVFHLPLVYLLGLIVVVHVGLVTYLGYTPFW